ncbi:MAG: radical SAM protein [Candidatus Thermoplasmatota archaeon]|nr:radical SAM protein [Candidatus Thermoplasmatota archaeon]
MEIKEITSKTALSPSKLPGLDYTLNPYSGCGHQCMYCYVPSVKHIPRESWEKTIFVRRNLPMILSKELSRRKSGTIGISTVTDPYQPIEKTFQVTRYCLEQLLKHEFPIQIQTKSDLILRDIHLIEHFKQAEIMISIGTSNDKHRQIVEPGTSSIRQRLNVLHELKNNDEINSSVFFGPIYPSMNWDEIKILLDTFIEENVSTILIDTLHLKPGLENHLSNILQKYPFLYDSFQQNIFSPSNWYKEIANNIKKYLQNNAKDISVTEAF